MKKVLITGANGFVGQHLIDSLKNGYQITGLIHESNLTGSENVIYKNGNILDRGFLEDILKNFEPEYVIHLAAIAPTWSTDPENIFKVNLLGTLNLYQAINSLKKSTDYNPKILYISSAEIYGKTSNPENIKEDNPLFPFNYYGASKVAADRLSYQMSQSSKLNIIILRPFNHTGPGQLKGFFMPDMASQIAQIERDSEKKEIMVGNLESIKDFLDVRDVVGAYKKALEIETKPGEAFNLSSGKGIKMEDLLKKLISFAKKEIKISFDNQRMRPSEVPVTVGNNSKFKSHFSWEPKIPIDQTLLDTLNYWRSK